MAGFGESSMLLALTMGRKFGLFCPSPLGVPDFEDRVAQYGLKDRCVGVVPGYLPAAEQEAAMVDAHAAIEEFTAVARELIARGAEVIIPGCGLIAPCVRFAPGCRADYPNGVYRGGRRADHGPLRGDREDGGDADRPQDGRGLPGSAAKGLFARPSAEAMDGGRSVLEYTGPGFWDCYSREWR